MSGLLSRGYSLETGLARSGAAAGAAPYHARRAALEFCGEAADAIGAEVGAGPESEIGLSLARVRALVG